MGSMPSERCRIPAAGPYSQALAGSQASRGRGGLQVVDDNGRDDDNRDDCGDTDDDLEDGRKPELKLYFAMVGHISLPLCGAARGLCFDLVLPA